MLEYEDVVEYFSVGKRVCGLVGDREYSGVVLRVDRIGPHRPGYRGARIDVTLDTCVLSLYYGMKDGHVTTANGRVVTMDFRANYEYCYSIVDIRYAKTLLKLHELQLDVLVDRLRKNKSHDIVSMLRLNANWDVVDVMVIASEIRTEEIYEMVYTYIGNKTLLRCCYYRLITEKDIKDARNEFEIVYKYGTDEELKMYIKNPTWEDPTLEDVKHALKSGRNLDMCVDSLYEILGDELPVELLDVYNKPPDGKGWLKQMEQLKIAEKKYQGSVENGV